LQSTGRGFDSGQFHFTWLTCLHTCESVTKQYNLALAKGGDVMCWKGNCRLDRK